MSKMQNLDLPQVRYSQTSLGITVTGQGTSIPGGLDLLTPPLRLQPGALSDVLNFECSPWGGYTRVGGYERFDGHVSPSAATFIIVQVSSFATVPAVGDVLTQAGTSARGTVVTVVTSPIPYLVLTRVSGTFDTVNALLGAGAAVGGLTADTTTITADSSTITADSGFASTGSSTSDATTFSADTASLTADAS